MLNMSTRYLDISNVVTPLRFTGSLIIPYYCITTYIGMFSFLFYLWNKAKQSEPNDLYDVITQREVALEYLRLRPKVEALDVPMPLHMR